jgi:putative membrane protein insertion efficiency factor
MHQAMSHLHDQEHLIADPEPTPELWWGWKITNFLPILLICAYKLVLSPFLGGSCRFEPSCSSYALEAFQTHNFFAALWLTIWRILRCNPFVKGGFDPVPKPHSHKH